MPKAILACNIHDYVEIACMFRYQVELDLVDGNQISGTCLDTGINADKEEYLLTQVDNDGIEIALSRIAVLRVITPGAKFEQVKFTPEP